MHFFCVDVKFYEINSFNDATIVSASTFITTLYKSLKAIAFLYSLLSLKSISLPIFNFD